MNATTASSTQLSAVQNALKANDLNSAETLVHQWLVSAPDNTDALYFKAVIERSSQRLDDAIATLNHLLTLDPLHSRALQERGHVWRAQHQTAHALNDFQRATRLNPSLIASWSGQVALLAQLGQLKAAHAAEQQLLHLKSLPPPLIVVMDLTARGRLAKAEDLCKRFMRANPKHVEGMRLLADIAVQLGALDEAELLLSTAAQLEPDNLRVAIAHVHCLRKQQQFAAAQSRAEQLLKRHPNNPQVRSIAAVEAMQIGDYARALEGFEAVLEQVPGDPVTLTAKGHALKTCGESAQAIASYRAALDSDQRYGEAWYALANLKTYTFSDADIDTMERLSASGEIDHHSEVFLRFALGKAHEDKAAYERAFTHYAAGNLAKRRQSNYSAQAIADEFERQKAVCTRELFEGNKGGCLARDPIFIVGLPRAGSTLIEQILASHPEIDGTLELPNILSLVQRLRRRGTTPYPDNLVELSSDELRTFGEEFLRDTAIHRAGAPLFIDKMPNNFRHIGLIKLILPNAKIIDARRNPLACCFSGFKQLFAEGQEFSYDLTDIGRYYRDYVALMTHWHAVLPGEILQVNNEDIIADLEQQVRALLHYCGLPFHEGCLRYWETERAVKTPSSEQVRRPVSSAGQYQWQHFEPWLSPLKEALGPDLIALSTPEQPS